MILLILLPILPKMAYYVTTLQFYVNRIVTKIKVESLQMLGCKSLLILIALSNEIETTPFKHLVIVNRL